MAIMFCDVQYYQLCIGVSAYSRQTGVREALLTSNSSPTSCPLRVWCFAVTMAEQMLLLLACQMPSMHVASSHFLTLHRHSGLP